MILTGKCKEKFLEWFSEPETYFYRLNNTCQNALIIEFFDEIGVHINSFYRYIWRIEIRDFRANLLSNLDFADFETRQQATIQAIKKANDLYNSRYENV